MSAYIERLFEAIAPPEGDNPDKPIYAVVPVPGHEHYFLGKDRESYPCLLVAAIDQPGRMQAPIRLEKLDVQFELRCHLRRKNEVERVGTFTVTRCRSLDPEIVRYFLSVSEIIVAAVGDRPRQRELASAIHRLAAIFQKMQKPPVRPVNGLFGEVYLIWRSGNPVRAVQAWRVDDTARFDFADGDIRVDVKAASGRVRSHEFSYEQCNPPTGTAAVLASLFVERSPGGITLRALLGDIEARIAAFPDLVVKLHEIVATTLGSSLAEAMGIAFDTRLADSSLRFYRFADVPAIRGVLPPCVSDVHFKSDVSSLTPLSIEALVDQNAAFDELLPGEGA